jgi:polyphosphate kinase
MPSKPRNEKAPQPQWRSFSDYLKKLSTPNGGALAAPAVQGKLLDRDLSWLNFNDRVLSEAADDSAPPLERLKFATIVSSNLDEFFMVRVAELQRRARRQRGRWVGDPQAPGRILAQVRDHVLRQKSEQAAVLRDIFSVLAREGLLIYSDFGSESDIDGEMKERLPDLKFIIRRNSEPLPPLLSERLHVFIRFPEEYAIITLENRAERLIRLEKRGRTLRFALLERWIAARAATFFPGREVIEAFPFKIIRDADLRYHPDDEESLEEQIVEAVGRRLKARIIRLEVDAPNYSEGAIFLATHLGLDSGALYRFDLPLDLRTLAVLYGSRQFSRLRYPAIRPQVPPMLSKHGIFDTVRSKDVLLHHPYDSFDVIVRFLKTAARDPKVTHIFHTMYRTSRESPVMEALKEGVRRGKKVTAYIEIKARFDELNNVRWAEELRKAGVKVIQPMGGFKVHCKLTQVVRNEANGPAFYTHLGTGNYHPGTARQYTDIGLLTADSDIGEEVKTYFRLLASRRRPQSTFKNLLIAPTSLQDSFLRLIRQETAIQRNGGKAHIIAKMNALVDPDVIGALYDASRAGVKVELLVRGICCLRPGVKGMSENIKVTSIVDRFLEHSRIYYFRANGAKRVFLSSADWMPRNFYARYEVAFPVKDPILKKYLRYTVLSTSLADNVRAWSLKSDGTYERVPTSSSGRHVRSQFLFEELAMSRYKNTVLAARP